MPRSLLQGAWVVGYPASSCYHTVLLEASTFDGAQKTAPKETASMAKIVDPHHAV